MNTRTRLAIGAVIALLAGTALPAAAQDSAHGVTRAEYDLGDNEHLRLWQQLATAGSGPLAGRLTSSLRGHVDMTRVGTLGHSRGGKGVMWQASDKSHQLLRRHAR